MRERSITVRLRADERRLLDVLAAAEARSVGDVIRQLVLPAATARLARVAQERGLASVGV
jgi:uncharacterized protein (DUF1778 family)